MPVARNAVIANHVALEVKSVDRLYLYAQLTLLAPGGHGALPLPHGSRSGLLL